MAILKTVVYVCDICGTEIAVTGDGTGLLSPVYCCGMAVGIKNIKEMKKGGARKDNKKPVKKTSPAKKSVKKSAKARVAGKTAKKVRK